MAERRISKQLKKIFFLPIFQILRLRIDYKYEGYLKIK